ncbi:WG repeat-containing protein [Flammeovirga aprica]|uniref:WG repeat-containing protein n=1 Tax=Flammeovirga aprica JL-4 TaxID=694437 RepID=A0A7X9S0Z3_9BACT|nr:WG repeat-containing protein [Flammeovirga aprica]NME72365.1 WG repeat-containing protein [Flammeovirga aprica JL-4]
MFDDHFETWPFFRGPLGNARIPEQTVRCYHILYNKVVLDAKGRVVNVLKHDWPIDNVYKEYGIGTSKDSIFISIPQGITLKEKGIFEELRSNYILLEDGNKYILYDIITKKRLKTSLGVEYFYGKNYWVHNDNGSYSLFTAKEEKVLDVDALEVSDYTFDIYTKGNKKGVSCIDFYTEAIFEDAQVYDEYVFLKKENKWAAYNLDLEPFTGFDFSFIHSINSYTFRLHKDSTEFYMLTDSIVSNDLLHYSKYDKTIAQKTAAIELFTVRTAKKNYFSGRDQRNSYHYGYTDKEGNLKIPYQFERAGSFVEGTAIVYGNHKPFRDNYTGVINTEGDFIIQPVYDFAHIERVGKNYFLTDNDDKSYTLFNDEGEVIKQFDNYEKCTSYDYKNRIFSLTKENGLRVFYDCKTLQSVEYPSEWFHERNLKKRLYDDIYSEGDTVGSIIKLTHKIDNTLNYLEENNIEYSLLDSTLETYSYRREYDYRIYTVFTPKKINEQLIYEGYDSLKQTKKGFIYYLKSKFNQPHYYNVFSKEKASFDGAVAYYSDTFEKYFCVNKNNKKGVYNITNNSWDIPPIYDEIVQHRNWYPYYLRKGNKIYYANNKGVISKFSSPADSKLEGYLSSERFIYFKNNKSVYDLKRQKFLKIPSITETPFFYHVNHDLIMISGTDFYNIDKGIKKNIFSDTTIFHSDAKDKFDFHIKGAQENREDLTGLIFSLHHENDDYSNKSYGIFNEFGEIIVFPVYSYIQTMTSKYTYGASYNILEGQINLYKIGDNLVERLIENKSIEYLEAYRRYENRNSHLK